MTHYQHTNKGTCSSSVAFDLEDGVIHDVVFTNGCNGNLQAISKLVEGMPAERVVALLKGNTCGANPTSCADQLALAIEKAQSEHKNA